MAWDLLTSGTVVSGTNSARVNLDPGEMAHVQAEYASATTNRIRISIFATNEDDPGVAFLDTFPLLEFRLPASGVAVPGPGRVSFPVGPGIHAFVVRVDDDQQTSGPQNVSAFIRVRKDNVDLTTAPS